MTKFLRTRAEKAHAVPMESPFRISGLRHGDFFYDPDAYRGMGTWIVEKADGEKHAETAFDESGYVEIRRGVAAGIEDPIEFYSEVTDADLYQGITSIVLDPVAHQAVLRKETGGRPVHQSREIAWSTHSGFLIRTPPSPDVPEGTWDELCDETPAEYLGGADHLESDPRASAAHEKHRHFHEESATRIFRQMKPGNWISITRFPKMVYSEGVYGASAKFVRAEPDGGPVERVITEFGYSAIIFKPRLVKLEHGPYAGIRVWAADDPVYSDKVYMFDDLPDPEDLAADLIGDESDRSTPRDLEDGPTRLG